jgi:Family of unknown function (DUF6152)
MISRLWFRAAVLAGVFALAVPLFAHHGNAAYDMSKHVTLKGTVTAYKFINPHMEIYFDVTDAKGHVVHWIAEGTTPNMLSRRGWTKDSIRPGEVITITGNQAKDGRPTMRVEKVVFSDGRVLNPNGTDFR